MASVFEWYGPKGCCCQGPCQDYQDNHTTFSDDFNDGFDPGWDTIGANETVVNGRHRIWYRGGGITALFRCDSHSGLSISLEVDMFANVDYGHTTNMTLGSSTATPGLSFGVITRFTGAIYHIFLHQGGVSLFSGGTHTPGDTLKMLVKPTASDTVFDFDFFVNNGLLFATTDIDFDFDRFGEAACQIPVNLRGTPTDFLNATQWCGETDNFIGSVTCA